MAEYLFNANQNVALNQSAIFENTIPCPRRNVLHENQTGFFILRGAGNNCFARYQVIARGNIAIPEGGTVGPIAMALNVEGQIRPTSKSIVTPAAVEEFGNFTSTAIVTVPKGCCFTLGLTAVPGSDDPTVTPVPVITLKNASMEIYRIA
jgi:hypothetical protein